MIAAPATSPWPLITAGAVLLLCLGVVVFAQGLFVPPNAPLAPVLGPGAPWLALAGLVMLAAGIAGWMGEGRRPASSEPPSAQAAAASALARRNAAVLWSLVAFIVLVFVITVVRLDPGEIERPPLTLHPAAAPPGGAP